MKIIEDKVKPERMMLTDNSSSRPRKEKWWLWGRYTPGLFTVLTNMDRVLMLSRVGQQGAMAFQKTSVIPSEGVVVFALPCFSGVCMLQSRSHELWARFFASSMKDDMRYTPSDCFETFTFPAGGVAHAAGDAPRNNKQELATLETAGREYYEFRAALMIRNNEGLTKTYNRFHDPHENLSDILKLRELHAAMDRVVLEAYGWHDLAQTANCDFLLDYEDDEDEDETSPARRQKKKPWRYRWPDDFRDEVLARLLELNKQRAEQERLAGELAARDGVKSKKQPTTRKKKNTNIEDSPSLFP
jgi:hypothetical protein